MASSEPRVMTQGPQQQCLHVPRGPSSGAHQNCIVQACGAGGIFPLGPACVNCVHTRIHLEMTARDLDERFAPILDAADVAYEEDVDPFEILSILRSCDEMQSTREINKAANRLRNMAIKAEKERCAEPHWKLAAKWGLIWGVTFLFIDLAIRHAEIILSGIP